jgi:hypothetical protein
MNVVMGEIQRQSVQLPFQLLSPGLGAGAPAPAGWQPIAARPLLILVGVTGVGKSTTLALLDRAGVPFTLLPDRRVLTDDLIIAQMQAAAGQAIQQVVDRKQRFDYTRRYRQRFPGGMAHALAQLWVNPAELDRLLIFDGLRGENEVAHAAKALPGARFVLLDAPDAARVQRLLGRNDAFDRVASSADISTVGSLADFQSLGVPEAAVLFTGDEGESLLELARQGAVAVDDLRAKLQIVVEERRNYDPRATLAALRAAAPARTLYVDTMLYPPDQVAQQIVDWLAET